MGQSVILIFLILSLLWFCYEYNFEHVKANNNKGIETSFLRGLDFHFLTTNFRCRELNLHSQEGLSQLVIILPWQQTSDIFVYCISSLYHLFGGLS